MPSEHGVTRKDDYGCAARCARQRTPSDTDCCEPGGQLSGRRTTPPSTTAHDRPTSTTGAAARRASRRSGRRTGGVRAGLNGARDRCSVLALACVRLCLGPQPPEVIAVRGGLASVPFGIHGCFVPVQRGHVAVFPVTLGTSVRGQLADACRCGSNLSRLVTGVRRRQELLQLFRHTS